MARRREKSDTAGIHNNIQVSPDLDFYREGFAECMEQYADRLPEPDAMAKNRNTFRGCMLYAASRLWSKPADRENIYNSMELLNLIWYLYSTQCYIYGYGPDMLEYCSILGVPKTTMDGWYNGETRREYNDVLKCTRSELLQRFRTECEAGTITGDKVTDIFRAKAVYGYVETAPEPVRHVAQAKTAAELPNLAADAAQIAQNGPTDANEGPTKDGKNGAKPCK